MKSFKITFIASVLALSSACTKEVTEIVPEEKTDAQAVIEQYAFNVRDSSQAECAAGGKVYEVYVDADVSGGYDVGERIVSSQAVCNGVNGANGANGADAPISPETPVGLIFPCGQTGAYQEVLLRLHSGHVLASFSETASGSMTRFVVLPDGNYMTTDSSGCQFSLQSSADGLTRSISWSGAEQLSWNKLY